MRINLLTADLRRKIEARRIMRMWAVLWTLCTLAAGGAFGWQLLHWREAQTRVAGLECQCEPLYVLQKKLHAAQERLTKTAAERDQLLKLQPVDNVLNVFAALAHSARSQEGTVQVQRFSLLTSIPVPGGAARSKTSDADAAKATSTCSLQGVAFDDAILAQFVAGLRESSVFSGVELKSSSQLAGEGATRRQYQIECRLEEQP
jgi:hypothetical protein